MSHWRSVQTFLAMFFFFFLKSFIISSYVYEAYLYHVYYKCKNFILELVN